MDEKLRLAFVSGGLCLISLAAGCETRHASSATVAGAERFAQLPGLQTSSNSQLQAEFERLKQEQAIPIQLAAHSTPIANSGYGVEPPAVRIERAFPALSRNLLANEIEAVFPTDIIRLRGSERERAREILRRQSQARELFRLAIPLEGGSLGLSHDRGLLADLAFLESVRIGCRLEVLDAADDLSEHRLDAALNPLEMLLRVAHALAAERDLTTRLAAVEIRADALRIAETITRHRFVSYQLHEQIRELVRRELANWPPDADAWIGDRALGLHTYELVRDGNFLSLLDSEEVARLEAKGLLKSTAQAALKNVDADELFYLQSMRRLIEASGRPYYERAAVLEHIRAELVASEATAEYPLVAGTILLRDFERGQQLQAEDLARLMAWQHGLNLSLAMDESEPEPINPLTGRKFAVLREGYRVVVSDIIPGDELVVKLRIMREPSLASPPSENSQQ